MKLFVPYLDEADIVKLALILSWVELIKKGPQICIFCGFRSTFYRSAFAFIRANGKRWKAD